MKKTLFALIAAVMVFSLTACETISDNKEPKKEPYSSSEPSKTPNAPAQQTFGLNETAVFDDLKFTATELTESKGTQFFEPDDGNVFVGVKFSIENISDEEQSISSMLLFSAYVDDVSSNLSMNGEIAFGDTLDRSIAPGKKLVGWYVVEAPKDWQSLELHAKPDWLSDSKAIFAFAK